MNTGINIESRQSDCGFLFAAATGSAAGSPVGRLWVGSGPASGLSWCSTAGKLATAGLGGEKFHLSGEGYVCVVLLSSFGAVAMGPPVFHWPLLRMYSWL